IRSCDDRTCGGDRRRRPDGADVGGRTRAGEDRRGHRRAARQPGSSRLACRRTARTHKRGSRSARNRRAIPCRREEGTGRGVCRDQVRHQRLSHPASIRTRPVAEAHRAHPRRLGGRAARDVLSRARGHRLRTGQRPGVDIALSDGQRLTAEYLVGCDGGRSLIRKAAGIDFPGWDPTTSALLAEVEMTEEPQLGIRRTPSGMHALGKVEYEIEDGEVVYQKGGTVGVMLTESEIGTREPTLRDLSEGLIAVYGTDYGIHSPTWITRFTDMTRQAAAYRAGRVLLAGDAAHVHSPVGGQGLNTGVQDAVNLGWKLAQVVNRISPESLLDTYHAERYAIAARVLRNTMAQVALM